MKQRLNTFLIVVLMLGMSMLTLPAQADDHCRGDHHGRKHCDQGLHRDRFRQDHRFRRDHSLLDGRSGQILKGGLLGAGIGAGAGLLLDKPVGKTAVLGAGLGAGTQAVRTSRYMNHHPIVKTATYGALVGAGASQLTKEGQLGKGALWGAAIGTGVGVLKNSD